MKNFKLGAKLIGGFCVTAAIALVIGLVGFTEITGLGGHVEEIGSTRLPGVLSLKSIETEMEQMRTAIRTLMSTRTATRRARRTRRTSSTTMPCP